MEADDYVLVEQLWEEAEEASKELDRQFDEMLSQMESFRYVCIKWDLGVWLPSLPGSLQYLALELPDHIETIPNSIGEMVNLLYLSIKGSNLSSLPNEITLLRNLQELELLECLRLQELPANMNALGSLTDLTIKHSNIKSLPTSITGLCHLQVLNLHECFGLEEFPENFCDLVSLRRLFIRLCKINLLPSNITELRNLQVLHLECSSLKELPDNLDDLTSLTNLCIRGNNKIKSLPDSITRLHSLQVLDLRNCSELENLPRNLNELVNLKDLIIRGTNIKFLPDTFSGLHNLQLLDVEECRNLRLPPNFNDLIGIRDLHIRGTSKINHNSEALNSPNQEFADELVLMVPTDRNASEGGSVEVGDPSHDRRKSSDERDHINNDGVEIGQTENNTWRNKSLKAKGSITAQDILFQMSQKKTLLNAAQELQVSRSTLKRKMAKFKIGPWSSTTAKRHQFIRDQKCNSNIESSSGSEHSQLYLGNQTSTAVGRENLNRLNVRIQQTSPSPSDSTTVERYQDHTATSFVVKAKCKSGTLRFDLLSTSTIDQLKEEIRKRIDVEASKFKIEYEDDVNEWILMTCDDDLQQCLRLSSSAGANCIRLNILDTTT